MDVSNERPSGKELFDRVIKLVAIWGTAVMVGEGINRLLSELLSRGWRLSISLLATYLFVLTVFWGGDKWPRLRDSFLGWRYPIAVLLAAYVGYQWHAHDYGRSREGRLNEAAHRACAKNAPCKKEAEDYLLEKAYDE